LENEDLSSPAPAPAVAAPAAAPVVAPAPVPAVPLFDPRRRIRELQSIPERDRSDAEWDELNELEIQTAPGNRAGNQQPMSAYGGGAKPGGSFHQKNRMKGKPGGGGGGKPGGGRPQQGGSKPHNNNPNKPRPA
jgi:hypothetical protein